MGSRERPRTVRPELGDEAAVRPPEPMPCARAITADTVRSLQRSAGNAAVGRLLARRSGPVLAREPEIAASDDEMGQRVVDDLNRVNAPRTATSGVHYAETYQMLAKTDDDAKAFWKEDYWKGYANPNYWDRDGDQDMAWTLKQGVDAAAAIKDWLAGLTIAECATVLVAIELDTMRAAVGDERFNEMFSSLEQKPERGLLQVNKNPGRSSTAGFMTATDEKVKSQSAPEQVGRRSVIKGEWYYFYNHPKYLLKHPGGSFQGENSICMDDTQGAQKYSGFGVGILTEPEMLDEMARAYNEPRNERDYELLVGAFASDQGRGKTSSQTWKDLYDAIPFYKVPRENWAGAFGGFPDQVGAKDILDAPALTIGNTTRKGGFQSGVGKKLDAAKVAAARNPLVLVQ
jgi:hypothetical protein